MPKPKPEVAPVAMPIRISPDLRDRLRALAAEQGRSLNALCIDLLERDFRAPNVTSPMGSTVEVLEIRAFDTDLWHTATVIENRPGGHSFVVEFLRSRPGSIGDATTLALERGSFGRAWR
jgi:hypothetical protein